MENFSSDTTVTKGMDNPFERAEKEGLIETCRLIDKLDEFHKKFVTRVMMEKRENTTQEIQEEDGIRAIEYHDYGKDGSKYIRDSVKLSDGKERVLAYQFDCPKVLGDYVGGASLIGKNLPHEFVKSFYLKMGVYGVEFFRDVNRQRPISLDASGLHFSSNEQNEWSRSWSEYFGSLLDNKVFLDALGRANFSVQNRRLQFINPLEVDMKQIMVDLEMIWNVAYSTKLLKKQFPKEEAPKFITAPKVHSVIPHQELQRMLSFALNRLIEDVVVLDEKDESKDPYR
jgi:hypothetical protein